MADVTENSNKPQSMWQKYIESNYDYVEMLYSDPQFKSSILPYWNEFLGQLTFKLVNTSERDDKVNLDVLRGKILAYQEMCQLGNICKQQQEQIKQREQRQHEQQSE